VGSRATNGRRGARAMEDGAFGVTHPQYGRPALAVGKRGGPDRDSRTSISPALSTLRAGFGKAPRTGGGSRAGVRAVARDRSPCPVALTLGADPSRVRNGGADSAPSRSPEGPPPRSRVQRACPDRAHR